jgi:hypothetical protein
MPEKYNWFGFSNLIFGARLETVGFDVIWIEKETGVRRQETEVG